MFGNHIGRRSKKHSGSNFCGSGRGRGQRGRCKAVTGSGYQNNIHTMDAVNWNSNLYKDNSFDENSFVAVNSLDKIEGVCPLCKNHCPLSAPKCVKGQAYAAKLKSGDNNFEI